MKNPYRRAFGGILVGDGLFGLISVLLSLGAGDATPLLLGALFTGALLNIGLGTLAFLSSSTRSITAALISTVLFGLVSPSAFGILLLLLIVSLGLKARSTSKDLDQQTPDSYRNF